MQKNRSSSRSSIEMNFYVYMLPSINVLQFFVHSQLYQYMKDLHQTDDQQAGVTTLFVWNLFFFAVSIIARMSLKKFNIKKLLTIYSILIAINTLFVLFYGFCIMLVGPSEYHY